MSSTNAAKTYDESLYRLIAEYRSAHADAPMDLDDVADWLLETDRHDVVRTSAKRQLKKDLARAARKKHQKDPQGRRVRTMHAARYERFDANGNRVFDVIWDHIETMSLEHGLRAFIDGRRNQIRGECKSLKNDVCSFNDNNASAKDSPIQLSLDFTFEVDDDEHETEQASGTSVPRPIRPK